MPGKNKTPLLGWHPASPELAPWVRGEAERRGVPQARILDEALAAHMQATEHTMDLSDADRLAIARACQLTRLARAHDVRDYTGHMNDTAMAYAVAFGELQKLVLDLVAIIERSAT